MKSGTGDDPFADESQDSDTSESTQDRPPEREPPEADEADEAEAADPQSAESATRDDDAEMDTAAGASTEASEQIDSQDIPWVLRRDGVKDDRPNMTQFFLRESTDRAERQFQQDVENILDKDVYLLDLREAAYQVAMEHPEEVATILQEWGYDYL